MKTIGSRIFSSMQVYKNFYAMPQGLSARLTAMMYGLRFFTNTLWTYFCFYINISISFTTLAFLRTNCGQFCDKGTMLTIKSGKIKNSYTNNIGRQIFQWCIPNTINRLLRKNRFTSLIPRWILTDTQILLAYK